MQTASALTRDRPRLFVVLLHWAIGLSLAAALWLSVSELASVRERLLWGFPGPLRRWLRQSAVQGAIGRSRQTLTSALHLAC